MGEKRILAIKDFMKQYVEMLFRVILITCIIRLFEVLVCWIPTGDILSRFVNNCIGFCQDTTIVFCVVLVMSPLGLLLFVAKRNLLVSFFRAIVIVMSIISICLVEVYSQASFPLDGVMFQYSLSEIVEIIQNSMGNVFISLVACILTFAICLLILFVRNPMPDKWQLVFLLVVVSVSCCVTVIYNDSPLKNNYNERTNKVVYFLRNLRKTRANGLEIPSKIHVKKFQSNFPNQKFISVQSPFLHTAQYSNSLAPFFELRNDMPNIVFICVEGLCRENCGPGSKYQSATPWLDSLIEESLFWPNCFSTSQKTCGALPAILGALPIGVSGFMSYRGNAPNYYSTPKILEKNGYTFSFLYGGNPSFDDMDGFIEQNHGKQNFYGAFSDKVPMTTWGICDKFLFSESFSFVPQNAEKRIDFYLTLTSHHPWDYPQKQHYIETYKALAKQNKKEMNPNVEAAASYVYVDEALQEFFSEYKKQKEFENTIFVITGDHNFNSDAPLISRYSVPLIIWSPLLKNPQKMNALVSHRDITPAIIGLLQHRYSIESPNEVAWINSGLDTSKNYRGQTFSPLIDPARNIIGILYHDYFIQKNEVYQIDSTLNLRKENNVSVNKKLQELYSLYKELDVYVCSQNALIENGLSDIEQTVIIDTTFFVDSLNPSKEFVAVFRTPLALQKKNVYIDFSAEICNRTANEAERNLYFVYGVRDKEAGTLVYKSNKIRFNQDDPQSEIVFQYKGRDLDLAPFANQGNELFMYIWNRCGLNFNYKDVQLKLYDCE